MNFVSFLKDFICEADKKELMDEYLAPSTYFVKSQSIDEVLESLINSAIDQYIEVNNELLLVVETFDALKIHVLRKLMEDGFDVQVIFIMAICIFTCSPNKKGLKNILEFLEDLIEMGGDISYRHPTIYQYYYLLNVNHDLGLLKLYLDRGADCTEIAKELFERSYFNFNFNNAKILEIVIRRGADSEMCMKYGNDLIFNTNQLSIVEVLVTLVGVDVNIKSFRGETPLLSHVCAGRTDIVRYLLDHNAVVNYFTEDGDTPLMLATKHYTNKRCSYLEIAKLLINHGAELYARHAQTGMTAFLYACENGYLEMMEILLGDPNHINDMSKLGKSSLMFVCTVKRKSALASAEYLLERGADLNMRNKAGKTVFDYKILPEIRELLEKTKTSKLAQRQQDVLLNNKRTYAQMSVDA